MSGYCCVRLGLAKSIFLFLALPVAAQCGLQWQPGAPVSGIGGTVLAVVQLPGGDLVFGGSFTHVQSTLANNLVGYDGTNWHAIGGGTDGTVTAAVVMQNGDLVVAGTFLAAGGVPANRIARWNGSTWAPLGNGLGGTVNALQLLTNGDLVAAGSFLFAGGNAANRIARWDGTAWFPLGSGLNSSALSLARLSNGNLVAGGSFTSAGGVATQSLATWDGTAWSAVPGLVSTSVVTDMQALSGGSFLVAGILNTASGATKSATVAGSVITPFPDVPLQAGGAIDVLPNGDPILAGNLTGPAGTVLRWNGTAWITLINNLPPVGRLFVAGNGDVIAAGSTSPSGVTGAGAVHRFDGTSWTRIGGPRPAKVNALARLPNGDTIVGGEFQTFGGVAASNVARLRNGVASALGLGTDGPVTALAVAPDGSVVAGGAFANAGGGPANRVARWTGVAWTTLGGGLPFSPTQLAAASLDQILAGGASDYQYFDGLVWSPLVLPPNHTVTSIASAPEGDFIVGGLHATPFGNSGSFRFGQGVISYTALQPLWILRLDNDQQGRVLAVLSSLAGSQMARLDGNTWTSFSTIPSGVPASISGLPNGDPLVLSAPYLGTSVLLRHDGNAWVSLQAGIPTSTPSGYRLLVTSSRAGEVFVAGELWGVNGAVSAGFARAFASCPASATPFGTGCTGGAGPLTLEAEDLPWLGGEFDAIASGFTTNALGVHVVGTQPSVGPLPGGAPGCSLFVTPDLLSLLLPGNGQAHAGFVLPRTASLAGVQLHSQVVGIELDGSGNLVRLTSTNALQLTIGSL